MAENRHALQSAIGQKKWMDIRNLRAKETSVLRAAYPVDHIFDHVGMAGQGSAPAGQTDLLALLYTLCQLFNFPEHWPLHGKVALQIAPVCIKHPAAFVTVKFVFQDVLVAENRMRAIHSDDLLSRLGLGVGRHVAPQVADPNRTSHDVTRPEECLNWKNPARPMDLSSQAGPMYLLG